MATYLDLDALNAAGITTALASEGYTHPVDGDVPDVYSLLRAPDDGYDPADLDSGQPGFYLYAQDTPEGAASIDDLLQRATAAE